MRALIPLLFLAACAPGGAVFLGDSGEDAAAVDTSGDEETISGDGTEDTEDTGGTEDTEDTEPVSAYAGEYAGQLETALSSDWGGYDLDPCDITATVSEEGALDGEAMCKLGGGWGGGEPTALPFGGTVTEDGLISGEMEYKLDSNYVELDSLEIEGSISEDGEMELNFYGEAKSDWLTVEITGVAALERE